MRTCTLMYFIFLGKKTKPSLKIKTSSAPTTSPPRLFRTKTSARHNYTFYCNPVSGFTVQHVREYDRDTFVFVITLSLAGKWQ